MTTKSGIEQASDRFYEALNQTCNGNPAPMADAWWHDDDVSTGHPMGKWVLGWESVWVSWVEFSKVITSATVRVTGLEIRQIGDVGYTMGTENVTLAIDGKVLEWSSQVTNVFRQKGGEWRVVHHHSDKAPSFEATV